MKGLRDLSGTLLFIAFIWTPAAIYGCEDGRPRACEAVNIMMTGDYMAVVILILICFIFAIALDKRNS